MYVSVQVNKCASRQVRKYESAKVGKYASVLAQVRKFASEQLLSQVLTHLSTCASAQVRKYLRKWANSLLAQMCNYNIFAQVGIF